MADSLAARHRILEPREPEPTPVDDRFDVDAHGSELLRVMKARLAEIGPSEARRRGGELYELLLDSERRIHPIPMQVDAWLTEVGPPVDREVDDEWDYKDQEIREWFA